MRNTPPGNPLADRSVRTAMRKAWQESAPHDPTRRHEEGGYIVQNDDGSYGVVRWPGGTQSRIVPPPRSLGGGYQGKRVIGEFHTHPHSAVDEHGQFWLEEPSPGDVAGIRREVYPGDSYVIGHNWVYQIGNDASVRILGPRVDILAHSN